MPIVLLGRACLFYFWHDMHQYYLRIFVLWWFFWDVIQFLWSLDLNFTYKIRGEAIKDGQDNTVSSIQLILIFSSVMFTGTSIRVSPEQIHISVRMMWRLENLFYLLSRSFIVLFHGSNRSCLAGRAYT